MLSFNVCDDVEKLSKEEAILFLGLIMRGPFLCERAQPDIQTAMDFLAAHVACPDMDNWKKLDAQLRICVEHWIWF